MDESPLCLIKSAVVFDNLLEYLNNRPGAFEWQREHRVVSFRVSDTQIRNGQVRDQLVPYIYGPISPVTIHVGNTKEELHPDLIHPTRIDWNYDILEGGICRGQ